MIRLVASAKPDLLSRFVDASIQAFRNLLQAKSFAASFLAASVVITAEAKVALSTATSPGVLFCDLIANESDHFDHKEQNNKEDMGRHADLRC